MISFIIIGRNEGWKLERCFNSVKKTIEQNPYIKAEVIYVDSNSTDNSIEIAKHCNFISIYKLTKDYNAPIARNLGASKANGDILYFIDGDMEIDSDFLRHVINQNRQLCYDFLGGYYWNQFYDENWEFLYSRQFPPKEKFIHDYFEASTGGLFIISREYWDVVGGMKNYLYRGADPDFAFRLNKKGIYKLRINHLMALHHMQEPKIQLGFKNIFSKSNLSGSILLYRENLNSLPSLRRMARNEYSSFTLFFSILTMILSPLIGSAFFLMYLLSIIFRSIKKKKLIASILTFIIRDFTFLIGFFLYWPNRKVNIEFRQL